MLYTSCPRQCSTPCTDDANVREVVSELHCIKYTEQRGQDSTPTIWGEEEGKGDTRRSAVAAGQAFDLCRQHVIIVVCLHPRYLG